MITLFLGLLVGGCGIVGLRSQHGKAAKIAGAIGLVVAAAVIGCYDVATIPNAAGDVPELTRSAGVRLTPVVGLLAAGLRPALGRLLGHGREATQSKILPRWDGMTAPDNSSGRAQCNGVGSTGCKRRRGGAHRRHTARAGRSVRGPSGSSLAMDLDVALRPARSR